MIARRHVITVVAGILGFACGLGFTWASFYQCAKQQKIPIPARNDAQPFKDQVVQLARRYLTGTPGEASQSLMETLNLAEDANVPAPARAAVSYVASCRLFVLQKRLGNDVSSRAAFLKARYWNLRSRETASIVETTAERDANQMSPEKCEEFVIQLDKAATRGAGPTYVKELQKLRLPIGAPTSRP
jgi:hypothetical protein